ncbi:lycopene cyclase family protein [uncultured Enterovirga sp.]|uniref:lycopene cyclase family protein n=1 Tax=uncultured Enterovirga sp. TaxID=2026352 RepID=UPI0035CC7213
MADRSDYDVVILGAGLAGLSLAVRLADLPQIRTLVLEPRTHSPRDRTWCSWRLLDHPFAPAVSASWQSWEVMRRDAAGRPVAASQTSAECPYDMIPSDRLWDVALSRLDRAPQVELRMGCRALGMAERTDGVTVTTEAGPIEAGLVFDSRPPPPGPPGDFVQRFLGQEVVTEAPVFDPSRATLMDFDVPQHPGVVHFLYVLPTSPTEALVEDTWLAPAHVPLPDHRAAIREYLGARFGVTAFTPRFEEEGAIPMSPGLRAPEAAGRVIPIGTAGGAVKPSSGYAFLAIQRMADELAAGIAAGRRPTPFRVRSRTASWMDEVFLSALLRAPEIAPHLFVSLFARCRPEPLIRFLNDVGSPTDIARVIAAMPKWPMIDAAFRTPPPLFGR